MTHQPRFHARNVQTLTMAVQREIERMILAGEVGAGERLSESTLAQAMGISRGPVREAMRGLMQAGLVEIIANKGVIVRRISLEEALDLYELRGAVFGLACELLAQRRTPEQVEVLRDNLAAMRRAAEADDRDSYYRHNVEFHSHIVTFCGNARARATYESIVKEMHLFRRRGLSQVPSIQASLLEHGRIVDAVAQGDAEAARLAGQAHVRNGKARFRRTLEVGGLGLAGEREEEIAAR